MSEPTNPEGAGEHPSHEDADQAWAKALNEQQRQEAAAAQAHEGAAHPPQTAENSTRDRQIEQMEHANKVLSVLVILLVAVIAGQIYFIVRQHQQFTALERQRVMVERQFEAPLTYFYFPGHAFGQTQNPSHTTRRPSDSWRLTEQEPGRPNSFADFNQVQDKLFRPQQIDGKRACQS